ncbi:type VI secretion system baseplate subunit TssK [Zooshikella sp. RANM57]|uniref:type VI secretion system baseplate subunit TssK n=1 Tax=Zooshikella sp. RANM57 TaxID=3425863 RepID=UPI003D70197B
MSNRLPEKIQWAEGMLLTPQHFQQQDHYWQAMLQFSRVLQQPYHWGIVDCQIDKAALLEGQLVVEQLTAMMPSGLFVQFPPPEQQAPLAVDLSELKMGSQCTVQLAVPRPLQGGGQSQPIQRYITGSQQLVADENTGVGEVAIYRIRPKLTLQMGETLPPQWETLKLFEIESSHNGQLQLTGYHPPMLYLESSAVMGDQALLSRVQLLVQRLRMKATELAGSTPGHGATASPQQRPTIYQLVSALPALEVLVRSEKVHPFTLYLQLAEVIGALSPLELSLLPMRLPKYDHNNIAAVFHPVLQAIERLISKVNVAYDALPFEKQAAGRFIRVLGESQLQEPLLLELTPHPGQSSRQMMEWLKTARIASEQIMPVLRQRRLTGALVRRLSTAQCSQWGLTDNGCWFLLRNQQVTLQDKAELVIAQQQPLCIEGSVSQTGPAAITLYRPRRKVTKTVKKELADVDAC